MAVYDETHYACTIFATSSSDMTVRPSTLAIISRTLRDIVGRLGAKT